MDLKDLGDLFKKFREQKGLSPAELAEKAGLPLRSVKLLESGAASTTRVLIALLNAMDASLILDDIHSD